MQLGTRIKRLHNQGHKTKLLWPSIYLRSQRGTPRHFGYLAGNMNDEGKRVNFTFFPRGTPPFAPVECGVSLTELNHLPRPPPPGCLLEKVRQTVDRRSRQRRINLYKRMLLEGGKIRPLQKLPDFQNVPVDGLDKSL